MAQPIEGDGKHWMEIKPPAILRVEWPQTLNITFIGVIQLGRVLDARRHCFTFDPR